jgi:hypothetical protein
LKRALQTLFQIAGILKELDCETLAGVHAHHYSLEDNGFLVLPKLEFQFVPAENRPALSSIYMPPGLKFWTVADSELGK